MAQATMPPTEISMKNQLIYWLIDDWWFISAVLKWRSPFFTIMENLRIAPKISTAILMKGLRMGKFKSHRQSTCFARIFFFTLFSWNHRRCIDDYDWLMMYSCLYHVYDEASLTWLLFTLWDLTFNINQYKWEQCQGLNWSKGRACKRMEKAVSRSRSRASEPKTKAFAPYSIHQGCQWWWLGGGTRLVITMESVRVPLRPPGAPLKAFPPHHQE